MIWQKESNFTFKTSLFLYLCLAVEQRLDRDNFKDIDRYNEEDMAKYRANRFVGIGRNRFYTHRMNEADENMGRREEENYFGTTITDRENQHHENGMEENGKII